ncbi:MAG: hypothetical protein ABIL25_10495 [candidate division WOR-3 bacterium]
MAQVRRLTSLDEVLGAISEQERFFVLAEEWRDGLDEKSEVTAAELKELVAQMRCDYGDNFAFRAFNETLDLHWNGELGLLIQADTTEETQEVYLPLISDSVRFPAAGRLKHTKIAAKRSKDGFLRFVRLEEAKTGEG